MGTDSEIIEAELAQSKENLKHDLQALESELTHRVLKLADPRSLERMIKKHPMGSVAAATVAGLALGAYLLDKKRSGALDRSLDSLKDVAVATLVQVATVAIAEALPQSSD